MKNKSTLAKLLAEEDIFVIHKQMETAYFNSKSRELGLPIWKDEEMTKDIYDLMVCHEIGHALWTPLDMLEKAQIRKIDHSFVNILEDARIESKVKSKYPGSVGVFNRGYVDLMKNNFFGTAGKNISSLNLIDRINVFFKAGDTTIPFSDEEKGWVEKTAATKTPDDVLDLAEELYAWMKENAPEETEESCDLPGMPGMPDMSGESSESGESGKPSESSESDEGNEGSESNDTGNGESSDANGSDADDGDSNGGDAESKSTENGEGDSEDESASGEEAGKSDSVEGGTNSTSHGGPPVATTDDASNKGMDALRDKKAIDRIYARIPKINLKEIIVDTDTLLKEWLDHYLKETKSDHQRAPRGHVGLYWDKTLAEVETLKNDSKSTVAYMVKEFEMKKAADQYARAATSKTGSLDMGKLHTYKYNEDLFKKVTTLPGATNHGMVMVVDWSGSMSENLKGTLAQMYNLIWFCRRTNIPFEVFAFSDVYGGRESRANWGAGLDKIKAFKAGDIALHQSFRLLNIFSSNMSLSGEMTMMHILRMYAARFSGYRDWDELGYPYTPPASLSLGGTPLNDAIIATMDLVPQFKKDTGVQKVNTIFLTDGASNRIDGIYDYKLKDDGSHSKFINSAPEMRWGKTKTVITDPVMNKSYEINGDDLTNELIRMLKNRVSGMNVVGFFIAGSGKSGRVDKRTLYYLLKDHDWDKTSKAIKFINKNKYLAITQLGYDEYYILPGGNALAVENETLSDDLIGAGKGKLKLAFGKIAKGKISSRQLLNKFVSMVA